MARFSSLSSLKTMLTTKTTDTTTTTTTTTVVGGEATAIGEDTLATGDVTLAIRDTGPMTFTHASSTFTSTASSTEGSTAYTTADSYAYTTNADICFTFSRDSTTSGDGYSDSTSTTKLFAIDIECIDLSRLNLNFDLSFLGAPREQTVDGNVATFNGDATVEGENTYLSTTVDVFTLENQMSLVVAETYGAVG